MTADEMVIEALAESEACLRARVESLEVDVAVYRRITYAALSALSQVTARYDRLRVSVFPTNADREAA
jgi:hypothetical protein